MIQVVKIGTAIAEQAPQKMNIGLSHAGAGMGRVLGGKGFGSIQGHAGRREFIKLSAGLLPGVLIILLVYT